MEVGQGPNWGCSAKRKEVISRDKCSDNIDSKCSVEGHKPRYNLRKNLLNGKKLRHISGASSLFMKDIIKQQVVFLFAGSFMNSLILVDHLA
jgi:hypothetical protein